MKSGLHLDRRVRDYVCTYWVSGRGFGREAGRRCHRPGKWNGEGIRCAVHQKKARS